jgi:hypothetical protein
VLGRWGGRPKRFDKVGGVRLGLRKLPRFGFVLHRRAGGVVRQGLARFGGVRGSWSGNPGRRGERTEEGWVCRARRVVLGHSGTFWDFAAALFCAGALGVGDPPRAAGHMGHGVRGREGCATGGTMTRFARACWSSVLRAVLRARGAAGATELEKVGFWGDFAGKIFGLGFEGVARGRSWFCAGCAGSTDWHKGRQMSWVLP